MSILHDHHEHDHVRHPPARCSQCGAGGAMPLGINGPEHQRLMVALALPETEAWCMRCVLWALRIVDRMLKRSVDAEG